MFQPFVFRHHDGHGGILETDLIIAPQAEWDDSAESESPYWAVVRWQGLAIVLTLPEVMRGAPAASPGAAD